MLVNQKWFPAHTFPTLFTEQLAWVAHSFAPPPASVFEASCFQPGQCLRIDTTLRGLSGLGDFTARCGARHESMAVYDVDGVVAQGGHDDYLFSADQGDVYQVVNWPIFWPIFWQTWRFIVPMIVEGEQQYSRGGGSVCRQLLALRLPR